MANKLNKKENTSRYKTVVTNKNVDNKNIVIDNKNKRLKELEN